MIVLIADLTCTLCGWTLNPDRTLPTTTDVIRDQTERCNDHIAFLHPERRRT